MREKADTFNVDDVNGPFGFSQLGQTAGVFQNVLNSECASNAISMLCHSTFKECRQVETDPQQKLVWLPSLLCRSECDRHLEKWNTCLDSLEIDPKSKASFDDAMLFMVLFAVHLLLCPVSTFSYFFNFYRAGGGFQHSAFVGLGIRFFASLARTLTFRANLIAIFVQLHPRCLASPPPPLGF
jgi:hypothetical protein